MRNSRPKSYDNDRWFRSRIVMARHGFGRGEYKYFAYPLPELVAALRTALYPPLATIANRWNEVSVSTCVSRAGTLPSSRAAGSRPDEARRRCCCVTGVADFNCLHQDVYGEHVFPLQVAFLLSEPGRTSPAANSCSPSSGRACSRAPRWCRWGEVRQCSFRSTTGRCGGRAASTGSTCATA